MEEIALSGEVQGVLLRPDAPSGLGVLVLAGSSGRVDVARAKLFADRGAVTLAQRWFGGPGQSPGICMIPLEIFGRAIDRLVAEGCERILMLGTSKGAEATLLTAVNDPRVGIAVALSPTSHVWAASGIGLEGVSWFARSSWTRNGQELPFMAMDPRWRPAEPEQPRFRSFFEQSLKTFAEDLPAAEILVERSQAEFVFVAGGDDAIWPSVAFAETLGERLTRASRRSRVLTHPEAGHRVIFPGEPVLPEPAERAWGGSVDADRELGAMAWTAIADLAGFAS